MKPIKIPPPEDLPVTFVMSPRMFKKLTSPIPDIKYLVLNSWALTADGELYEGVIGSDLNDVEWIKVEDGERKDYLLAHLKSIDERWLYP